jgi:hypothetical protein
VDLTNRIGTRRSSHGVTLTQCHRLGRRPWALLAVLSVAVGLLAPPVVAQASPDTVDNYSDGISSGGGGGFDSRHLMDLASCNTNPDMRPALTGTVSALTDPVAGAGALVVAERQAPPSGPYSGEPGAFVACAFADAQGRFALNVTTSAYYQITVDTTVSAYAGTWRTVSPENFGQDPASDSEIDLGEIKLVPARSISGQVSVSGMTVPGIGPGVPVTIACLHFPVQVQNQDDLLWETASCSVLRVRPDLSGGRFVLGYEGDRVTAGAKVSVAVGAQAELAYGELTLSGEESPEELAHLLVEAFPHPHHDDGDGHDGGPGDGCDGTTPPNVTGTVSASTLGYAGSKVHALARNALIPNQPGWAYQPLWLASVTDANGRFGLCIDFESSDLDWLYDHGSIHELQLVATSLDRGPDATLGDSASAHINIANRVCNACEDILIEMQAPTLKGRIDGAERVNILQDVPQFSRSARIGRLGVDADGNFAAAFPFPGDFGDYSILATDGEDNELSMNAPLWTRVAALPLILVGSLPNATHRIEVRRPSGDAFGPGDNVYSELWRTDGEMCGDPGSNDWDLYLAGCSVAIGRVSKGFSASLSAGNYRARLQARIDNQSVPESTFSFTVDDQGSIINNPDNLFRPDGADRWYFRLSEAQFSFDLRDAAGQQVSTGAGVTVERVNLASRWYEFASGVALQSNGTWGWTPAATSTDGIYRLRVEPPPGRLDLGYTSRFFKTAGPGSSAEITHLCSMPFATNGMFLEPDQIPFISDGDCTPYTPTGGYSSTSLRIDMDVANLTFSICGPTAGGDCPALSQVQNVHPEVEVWRRMVAVQEVSDNESAQYFLQRFNDTWLYRTPVQPGGMGIELPVPANGIDLFTIEMMPPYTNTDLLTAVTTYLLIVSKSADTAPVGWNNGWYLCESDACTVRTPLDPNDAGLRTLGNVSLAEPKIVLQAQRPDGTPLPRSWVNLQRQQPCWWDALRLCFEYVRSFESRLTDGLVGLDLAPGIYEVQVNPPFNDTSNDAPGRVLIEVGSNGLVARATASGMPLSEAGTMADPLPLKLADPNVVAVVRADGEIRRFVGVGLERWDPEMEQWNWANQWSQSDSQGVVRFSLDDGKWRLRAWPQGNDSGVFTEALLEIEIAQGVPIKVAGGEYTTGDPIFVDYGVPNLNGVLQGPTGDPIAMAGLGLQEWNGQYFQGGAWATTRGNGAYAFTVTPHDNAATYYRLEVNPPAGQGVRTARFLYVPPASDTNSYMCFIEREEVGTGDMPACATQGPTSFDITLAGPNVTGVVVGALGDGDPAPQAAWVYARKWNGTWFDWIDQWSEARAGSGTFDFVLDAPGFYEITAEPRVGSGFTKTSLYVSVSATSESNAYCLSSVQNPDGRDEPNFEDCRPPQLVGGRVPLVLTGANLRGAVSYSVSNSAGNATLTGNLSEGWVEVFDTTGEWPQWVDSVGLSRSGGFALRLESRSITTATRYQVVVSPSSWNPQISTLNLGKERRYVWATTSGQTTQLCSNDPALGPCEVLDSLTMVMGGGNVRGVVTIPGGTDPVRDSQISVERWDSTFGYWMWANEWTHTGDGGRFALSLEPGSHYRLNIRPPWGSSEYSPTSVVIRVDDPGWCLVAVGTDCAGTYASTLEVSLGEPNVRATVLADGSPQRDVWVGIERQVVEQWGISWQWTGNGTNTGANGNLGLRVDAAGTYRVVVEAPWGSSAQDLTRFTREFTVAPGGVVTWVANTTVTDGRAQLTYPEANAVFVVQDSTGANVRDAWVYLERRVEDRWEWAHIYGSTRSNGRVALRLPDAPDGVVDTYRVTVNPPWNRTGLARFSTEVTVSGSTVNRTAGFTLVFPSANVNGVILAAGAAEGAATVPNRFGWIEVRGADGSWIEGISSNQDGRFSLYLPHTAGANDTTVYTLIAHPNYGQLSARPMRLTVTVSGETPVLVGCTYSANGASCLTDVDPAEVRAGFDFVPPNFIVSVTTSAGPVRGAFVRITDEADGSFVDLVTDNDGVARASLPTGRTYRVRAAWVNGEVTTGESNGHVLADASAVVNVTIQL